MQMETKSCGSFQCTKRPIKKHGKIPPELVDKTTWNKRCLYLMVHYKTSSKGKLYLVLKNVTMINSTTGYF